MSEGPGTAEVRRAPLSFRIARCVYNTPGPSPTDFTRIDVTVVQVSSEPQECRISVRAWSSRFDFIDPLELPVDLVDALHEAVRDYYARYVVPIQAAAGTGVLTDHEVGVRAGYDFDRLPDFNWQMTSDSPLPLPRDD
jgi:hypothetical protein